MFLLKIRSERQETAFQTSVIDTLDGIGKFLADALVQTELQLPSLAEPIKKKSIHLADLNVLSNAFEKALNDSQSTLVAAGLISKHILQDSQNIFQILDEVLLKNKKNSFEVLDFMSKQKIFYPVLHKILETLKQERDSSPLNKFIEILCESESILYVHNFTSEIFVNNKMAKLNPVVFQYAIKNNYEFGQIKEKETIIFFDGSSIILSGKDFSEAAGEYVFVKRDKQNLIEFKDHDLKEYKWKIREDYVIGEDQFIFFKSSQGKIIATFLRGFQKVYSNAEEFLAGNGEAVLSLKQKGLYIPFLEEGKLFYIIYDKEKLFAVQNGKTTPVFDVKDYDINNWQRNVISTLQRIVRENYKENPLFLKKTGNLIDRLHDSFIGFCGFYGGLGAFATLVSSFFVNNSIYALGAGLLLPLSVFLGAMLYAFFGKYIPYGIDKKLKRQYDVIDKEAMDFYLEYHNKN